MSVSGRSGDEDKPDREDQYRTSGKPGFAVRCDMVRGKKAQVPRGRLQPTESHMLSLSRNRRGPVSRNEPNARWQGRARSWGANPR